MSGDKSGASKPVLSKEDERWASLTATSDTLSNDELATSAPGATHGQQHVNPPLDTSAVGGKVGAHLNAATHKLQFPKYDGSDALLPRLHHCEQFFQAIRTPKAEKVWLASFYMQGTAQQWYYYLERNHGTLTWTRFTELANIRFAPPPPTRSSPLGELCHLRLDGSLNDDIDKFYQRLTRCDELSEPQQIAIFTAGLGEPLKTDVELDAPKTMEDATALAHAYIPLWRSCHQHHHPTAPPGAPSCPLWPHLRRPNARLHLPSWEHPSKPALRWPRA
jgi:hypothetical protein